MCTDLRKYVCMYLYKSHMSVNYNKKKNKFRLANSIECRTFIRMSAGC